MKEYKLAVIGNPIEHSLSPIVFKDFASQFGIKLTYEKILAKDTNQFNEMVSNFFDMGGLALNITSPYKHAAYLVAKSTTSRAKFCKAGNFLYMNDNHEMTIDTTDGIGLTTDLEENHTQKIATKKILIIGSGFVLDSILLDLIVKNPSSISILARNHDRTEYLKHKFSVDIYNPHTKYDIIVNSSPNIVENTLFNKIETLYDGTFCYDLGYAKDLTSFLQLMHSLNPNIIMRNGLGMLFEQAKVAFSQLFDKKPQSKNLFKTIDIIRNI